jgi:hypothetical protein
MRRTPKRWIARISRRLESGWLITIDYGYTEAEAARFANGTLMSYRRHTASEDLLGTPGEGTLPPTSTSALSPRAERSAACRPIAFRPWQKPSSRPGKEEFARTLAAPDAAEESRRRL